MATVAKNLVEISGIADNIPLKVSVFKSLTVQDTLALPREKPDMEQIVKVIAEASTGAARVIRVPGGKSLDGRISSGFSLIISGEVKQKIEYASDGRGQFLHAAHFEIPFNTFIALPSGYATGTPVPTAPYIEDLCVRLIDKRTVFIGAIVLINAFS